MQPVERQADEEGRPFTRAKLTPTDLYEIPKLRIVRLDVAQDRISGEVAACARALAFGEGEPAEDLRGVRCRDLHGIGDAGGFDGQQGAQREEVDAKPHEQNGDERQLPEHGPVQTS